VRSYLKKKGGKPDRNRKENTQVQSEISITISQFDKKIKSRKCVRVQKI
jgi:hypothetical protein